MLPSLLSRLLAQRVTPQQARMSFVQRATGAAMPLKPAGPRLQEGRRVRAPCRRDARCQFPSAQVDGMELSVLQGLEWRLGPVFDLGAGPGSGP